MLTLAFGRDVPGESLSLSGVVSVGEHLFLAPDEGASVVRVTRRDQRMFDRPVSYLLSELVPLPGEPGEEVDLEGLDAVDGYLWCVGSHSAVRKRVKRAAPPQKVADDLAEVTYPAARRVLARIPVDADGSLVREVPQNAARPTLTAAALSDAAGRGLRDVLAADPHVGPFVPLPGKDNGLDVEGLVALDSRILVGLRGPVLRSWAVVVELAPVADPADPRQLILGPLTTGSPDVYALHFLDLDGLGVRDLARVGDDLLILAGPTMVLDGPARILRIAHGATSLPLAVHRDAMTQLGPDLPPSHADAPGATPGTDHPEGITIVGGGSGGVVVVYDSPTKDRARDGNIRADVIELP
jgi:hypothetical protein